MITSLLAGCLVGSAVLPPQEVPWTPPPTKLPVEFVQAVEFLHRHGLADPRGGELRRAKIVTGDFLGHFELVDTFGWVLPARPGEPSQLVTLYGLSYPTVSVGEPAPLAQALTDELNSGRLDRGGSVSGRLASALLLIRGEEDAAERTYSPERSRPPFVSLATAFLSFTWDRALLAHMRGDDEEAFRVASALAAHRSAYEGEARRVLKEDEFTFEFLKPLDAFVAETERRRSEKAPAFDLDATLKLPPPERIRRLVEALDEVSARQWSNRAPLDMRRDPIVQALVAEGNPALGPLFGALKEDKRLTRSVGYGHSFMPGRTLVPVSTAARTAIREILGTHDLRDPQYEEMSPEALEAFWRQTQGMGPLERWKFVLADDHAGRHRWMEAARNLLSPEGVVWRGDRREGPDRPQGITVRPTRLESLSKSERTRVAELFGKRALDIAKAEAPGATWKHEALLDAMELARYAATLDLAANRTEIDGVIGLAMAACRPEGGGFRRLAASVGHLVATLARDGKEPLVDRYLAWLPTLRPEDAFWSGRVFEPLVTLRDAPKVARATRALFLGKGSPWNLREMTRKQGPEFSRHYLISPLLELEVVRNELMAVLNDRTVLSTFSPKEDGTMEIRFPSNAILQERAAEGEPLAPRPGEARNYRTCDSLIPVLREIADVSEFELYWPDEAKDRVIANVRQNLREAGSEIVKRLPGPAQWSSPPGSPSALDF